VWCVCVCDVMSLCGQAYSFGVGTFVRFSRSFVISGGPYGGTVGKWWPYNECGLLRLLSPPGLDVKQYSCSESKHSCPGISKVLTL
jgi:hypothetical protein